MISLTVIGDPVPKGRPRFGQGRTYTPPATVDAERAIMLAWQALRPRPQPWPADVPLALTVLAVLRKPKRTKREQPTAKPDWDNLGKLVSDALAGFAYADDKQIVRATVEKVYGTPARWEITLEEAY